MTDLYTTSALPCSHVLGLDTMNSWSASRLISLLNISNRSNGPFLLFFLSSSNLSCTFQCWLSSKLPLSPSCLFSVYIYRPLASENSLHHDTPTSCLSFPFEKSHFRVTSLSFSFLAWSTHTTVLFRLNRFQYLNKSGNKSRYCHILVLPASDSDCSNHPLKSGFPHSFLTTSILL